MFWVILQTGIIKDYQKSKEKQDKVQKKIAQAYQNLEKRFIDASFFDRMEAEKNTTVPWCDETMQYLRDAVFVESMKLHKAFIDAAAIPLRHNLGVLMNVFAGRSMPDIEKTVLLADLWSSLFLVVPCLSTTFASVERMLRALQPQSLGWLLIDEAGQALPQAAVGAIMRAKRAILVGDPMQIEPVVMLSDTLTEAICRAFEVDPTQFNAPSASAQTLADAATPYYAEFPGSDGSSRTVGMPLLVHRRCADPMFKISNTIAYAGLMVHAKKPNSSPIAQCLGPSRWFDVQGTADEKWCPEEGKVILELLHRLKQAEIKLDLYIVTPFKVVANQLRLLIRESGLLAHYTKEEAYQWTSQRIGTVHTVQGREAEAIFFVLGAPTAQQGGARYWAGSSANLLNVAVTRAKEALYVIGNRSLWKEAGLFQALHTAL